MAKKPLGSESPLLIIVSGPPGSGKTTLARRIAQQFRLPLFAKDDIKESLFESLGWRDREWSKKLGRATFDLLFYFAESQLSVGRSLILECNFDNQLASPRFRALQDRCRCVPLQIICQADRELLIRRFRTRWNSGARHPGHSDDQISETELAAILNRYDAALDIGGTIIDVNTNDFNQIDYKQLYAKIASVTKSFPNEVRSI